MSVYLVVLISFGYLIGAFISFAIFTHPKVGVTDPTDGFAWFLSMFWFLFWPVTGIVVVVSDGFVWINNSLHKVIDRIITSKKDLPKAKVMKE